MKAANLLNQLVDLRGISWNSVMPEHPERGSSAHMITWGLPTVLEEINLIDYVTLGTSTPAMIVELPMAQYNSVNR